MEHEYIKHGEKFEQNKNGVLLLAIQFPVLTLITTVIIIKASNNSVN